MSVFQEEMGRLVTSLLTCGPCYSEVLVILERNVFSVVQGSGRMRCSFSMQRPDGLLAGAIQ